MLIAKLDCRINRRMDTIHARILFNGDPGFFSRLSGNMVMAQPAILAIYGSVGHAIVADGVEGVGRLQG